MNILITGSRGLIGAALTKALLPNHRIIGLSRSGKADIRADVLGLTEQEITTILETHRVDMVIHCAADLKAETQEGFRLNSYGMQKIAMHPLGREKRHLLIGSVAEYGQAPEKKGGNDAWVPLPDSQYGSSKLLQTALAHFDREQYNVNIQVARLCSIVSPHAKSESFIGHSIEQAMKGAHGLISLDNDLKTQDFLDIRDACRAIELIAQNPAGKFLYEIGNGDPISFKEALKGLFEVLEAHGKPLPALDVGSHAAAYMPVPNITPLREDYGWSSQHTIKESLEWCLHEKGYL